ncbi:MAG TPA: phosphatase PAP2 family protein [Methylomirabilota bacterium]|jgi:membrane-associated phospholipid phosphatase|nr:phosphatase PAP2 family protein [Methylomirabilota bacterium]
MRSVATLVALLLAAAITEPAALDSIEPGAGAWTTWVIGPARALRLPPPPPATDSAAELAELRALTGARSSAALEAVAYWDVGPPSYRWNELAVSELLRRNAYSNVAGRELALLHVALHDATVVAWDSKHAYMRPRPTAVAPGIATAVGVPRSPSYPDERAVAAGAAATVLGALSPERAAFFAARSEEAARSRLLAGVSYPSDVSAGLALGRAVAARVLEHRRADGFAVPWPGVVPHEAGKWRGSDPILPQAGTWLPWTLASPGELRPPPPPAPGSARMATELEELRSVVRTPKRDADALFWEHAAGGRRGYHFWNDVVSRTLLEQRLDDNAPRAARAYAVAHVAFHDVGVACWEAKFAYWAIRPGQLDPRIQPLFATPNHPSYPSGHSCFSSAMATVLARLFPGSAAAVEALAREASESRVWAGIHFRSDVDAGRALGHAVGRRVLEHARIDADGG